MSDRISEHKSTIDPHELDWIPEAWMKHMCKGEFSAAWKLSDKVLAAGLNRNPQLPRHFQGVWDGRPLNGKRVLVRCYHGLGDTIQFIRYASLLKQVAAEVIVWAQAPLLELLKNVPGIDHVFALHDGTPDVTYDVDCEVMELPFIFRSTLESTPCSVPYLHAQPIQLSYDLKSKAGHILENGPKLVSRPPLAGRPELVVGLVWQAGDWNQARCIPFSALKPLAEIKGIKLFILQANPEAAGWVEGFGIYPGEFSLTDYAAVISGLDLLITADSMPAHLAGALNVPVWTLLHAEPDWRWMEGRNDSPWYPSMRLFRQPQAGNWEPVVTEVTQALKQLSASLPQVTS
jgi:hypothetical protein